MPNQFTRNAMLFGREGVEKLKEKRVAVFGLGGVGGHCAEALVRAGVGSFGLFDGDVVTVTNINRQVIATHKTIGQDKAYLMRNRMLEINPQCEIHAQKLFYLPETAASVDLSGYDYIIDAVDTMAAKLTLVESALSAGVPLISSMGTGNKLNPALFEIADIYETSVCPLARIMRSELRRRGVKSLKVCYSAEPPLTPREPSGEETNKRSEPPASCSFVPSVAGLIIASEVIRDLLDEQTKNSGGDRARR